MRRHSPPCCSPAPTPPTRACSWQGHHPLLNPLDVWVWEVMVKHGHLAHALAPLQPLVSARHAPSVKDGMG